jgi:hypothetical protein
VAGEGPPIAAGAGGAGVPPLERKPPSRRACARAAQGRRWVQARLPGRSRRSLSHVHCVRMIVNVLFGAVKLSHPTHLRQLPRGTGASPPGTWFDGTRSTHLFLAPNESSVSPSGTPRRQKHARWQADAGLSACDQDRNFLKTPPVPDLIPAAGIGDGSRASDHPDTYFDPGNGVIRRCAGEVQCARRTRSDERLEDDEDAWAGGIPPDDAVAATGRRTGAIGRARQVASIGGDAGHRGFESAVVFRTELAALRRLGSEGRG